MSKKDGLSARQRIAVTMLAGGATGRDTAAKVGVTEDTVSRWRRLPGFQSAVVRMIREAEGSAIESLHALRLSAVDRLGELLRSKNDLVALRAASEVLDRVGEQLPEPAHRHDADFQAFIEAIRSAAPYNNNNKDQVK